MRAPIAIVGQACVLPGAHDVTAFADNLFAGRDAVRPAPTEGRFGLPNADVLGSGPDRAWSLAGGYVEGFTPDLAGLPVERAHMIDPLSQWLLHVGRQALRDAGMDAGDPRLSGCGVVVGNLSFPSEGMSRWGEHIRLRAAGHAWRGPPVDARDAFTSGRPASDMARALGLGRGGFALDAACASALYAIKLACDALRAGRADRMLAGAVQRADNLFLHVGFCALGAMSRSGRSRPFHVEADGLVPAEGCALVVLRRLEDAVRDGDRILGVIRGVGLSNDGRARNLLAPSEEGQVRALRAAYAESGLTPADIQLVECHATGTPTGDRTEIATLARVFERSTPRIGSLKSMLGHLITAAGVAGLQKVLAGFARGLFPPTLHADAAIPSVEAAGFHLVHRAERWDAPVRRAAVSAFGFGGNNAHLVVESWPGTSTPRAVPRLPAGRAAVVALAAAVGDAGDLEALRADAGGRRTRIELPLTGLRFPPNDLRDSLPQQTLALLVGTRAAERVRVRPDRARVGVYVGMGCDAAVSGWGLRWRAAALTRAPGEGSAVSALEALRDAAAPPLRAEHVVGTMPNIPANRISVQVDAGGPGFTLSGEELSGLHALGAALDALAADEIDLALVGAVDIGGDPRTNAARAALGLPADDTDGAVFLALKRPADAARDGEHVVGTIDAVDVLHAGPRSAGATAPGAHAASGLLAVARMLAADTAAAPVTVHSFTGDAATVRLTRTATPLVPTAPSGPCLELPAHPELPVLPTSDVPPADSLVATERLAPAPALPPVGSVPTRAARTAAPSPAAGAPTATTPASPRSVGPLAAQPPRADLLTALAAHQRATATAHAAFLEEHGRRMASFHAISSVAHRAALELSTGAAAARAHGSGPISSAASVPSRAPSPQAPAHTPDPTPSLSASNTPVAGMPAPALARATAPMNVAAPAAAPSARALHGAAEGSATPARPPEAPRVTQTDAALPTSPIAPRPPAAAPDKAPRAAADAAGRRTPLAPFPRAEDLPGPKLSRADLEDIATGPISRHFGPAFAPQDAYARVVRMPAPPLLLCDRVLGIAGPPMQLGKGTIWTETDIVDGAWYLHDDRMRGGVFIEAGQADLLLASWQGIDVNFNKGERIYRLLGCDLTYEGPLPAVGETLQYEIQLDGHARLGAIRMFFFHYDCRVGDALRLVVRNGQAGFFSDAELAASGGILWDPVAEPPDLTRPLDPPLVLCVKDTLDRAGLVAFSEGRTAEAFGPGFERAHAHTWTPRIPGGQHVLLHRVTHLEVVGGPWQRGYLRAEWDVTPEDWFFTGHFHGDPCMPGTLMFDGCLQAMAVFLTALGYTLPRDGWRFEPRKGETFHLRCRGQVTPASRKLVYEVFVQDVWDGSVPGPDGSAGRPAVRAQILCTVDGLKCFHADPLTLELVPDVPMSRMKALPLIEAPAGTPPAYDHRSLLACAWGQPTDAFGPMYARFDGGQPVARLPGPPYHFMSRVVQDAPEHKGAFKAGAVIRVEHDLSADDWYFRENPAGTMPFAVLLEAALQPCGWLASYIGSALTTPDALLFRNLDGTGTIHKAVDASDGALVTTVTSTRVSRSGGMIIVGFKVAMQTRSGVAVYDLDTVFGFFPPEAFARQAGVGSTPEERAWLALPSGVDVDLRAAGSPYATGALCLPAGDLLMIDRLTGRWTDAPHAGASGLGRWRAEKRVDARQWFFKAHFYRDPVQPGSLGIEAMIQLLQVAMIDGGAGAGMGSPAFEPIASGRVLGWKYRGQVVPENEVVVVELEVTSREVDPSGEVWTADAWLWVDGLRIYAARGLAVRVVERAAPAPRGDDAVASTSPGSSTAPSVAAPTSLVPSANATASADEQPPTPIVPGVPAHDAAAPGPDDRPADDGLSADELFPPEDEPTDERERAAAAAAAPQMAVGTPAPTDTVHPDAGAPRQQPETDGRRHFTLPVPVDHCPTYVLPALPMMTMAMLALAAGGGRTLHEGVATRWLTFPDGPRGVDADVAPTLRNPAEQSVTLHAEDGAFFSARVGAAVDPATAETPEPLFDAEPGPAGSALYASGSLFHGPSFQLVERVEAFGGNGCTLLLRTGPPDVLLDAVTHGIPHDHLERWARGLPPTRVAYPYKLERLALFSGPPARAARAEVRFRGLVGRPKDARLARVEAWLYDADTGALVAHFVLAEALLPKGRIGAAAPDRRRDFLRAAATGTHVPGVSLSELEDDTATLDPDAVRASDWLPGTIARVYGTTDARTIAAKELAAPRLGVHPSVVRVEGPRAVAPSRPVRAVPIEDLASSPEIVLRARPARVDIGHAIEWWRAHLGVRAWAGERVMSALARAFLGDVIVHAPEAMDALRGRPVLLLANHQNYLESVLLTTLLAPMLGTPVRALAKVEHQQAWLGRLHDLLTQPPGSGVQASRIVWFDQSRPRELPMLARDALAEGPLLVHVEGTRQTEPGQRVTAISSLWTDLAIALDAVIVPVAFRGGLTGSGARHELPAAPQVHHIGAPIASAWFRDLAYADRRKAVGAAIDALGLPELAATGPVLEPRAGFAAALADVARDGTADDAWWNALDALRGR